jgi:hypothetical protein
MCSSGERIKMMRTKFRTLLIVAASFGLPLTLWSQASSDSRTELDLAVTYSAQHGGLAGGADFWRQGGAVELSAAEPHGFGLVMNIGGSHARNINGTGVDLTSVSTVFGPRYTRTSRSRKLAIFGQGLIGVSHGIDGVFPSPQGAQSDFDAFAMQVGGGLDFRTTHHFAVRPIQVEWLRTQFPNGATNVQNELRLSSGIVFRLQR